MLYTANQVAQFLNLSSQFQYIATSLSDHVLTIRLNRPEKKNALNRPMLNELAFTLAYAHHVKEVWMVILEAEGDTFCAGMDLKSLSSGDTASSTIPEPSKPVRLGELMANLHKPCIAKVQGPVYAGGFLLVGGSTYVVSADSVTFSLPEVKRGLFPFQVLAVLLDIMPARVAIDLCLRAQTLTAQEAQEIRLVTSVVSADELDQAVTSLVDELKQFSPTAMQFGLRAFQQLKGMPLSEQQAYLYDQFQQLQQMPDAQEGMAAFLEKRPPEWKG